jgi:hypothetical protein
MEWLRQCLRTTNAARTLRKNCAILAVTLRKSCAKVAQKLRGTCTNYTRAVQTPRKSIAKHCKAVQNRCESAAQK